MNLNFRRIISKGNFISEIDGLRFVAIMSVLIFHLNVFLLENDTRPYIPDYDFDFFNKILSVGHIGVPLFFVISGFILARPFAQMHMAGGSDISIKKYFLRRLTRLEPPYIIVMTLLLFAVVFLVKKLTLHEGILSYLASITYTHNFFYERESFPLLLSVAWSLEIEIQFYILMPLLAKVYLIKNKINRRSVLIGSAILFLFINQIEALPFRSIVNYIQFFLVGLLLADIYVSKKDRLGTIQGKLLMSLMSFAIIWIAEMVESEYIIFNLGIDTIQLISIFAFNYLVLFHRSIKFMSNKIITNIGGMCYSIYLLHYSLISIIGNPIVNQDLTGNSILNTIIYSIVIIGFVLIASAVFFLLVERPCMEKDWYKKLFKKFKS